MRGDGVLTVAARMRYPISAESGVILGDLDDLRMETRELLDSASPGAREEWKKLERRFPSELEVRRGLIALSSAELDEMRSKVRRFRDILAASRREAETSGGTLVRDPHHADYLALPFTFLR